MEESTDLVVQEETTQSQLASVEAEKAEAMQRVQAPYVVARKFPRSEERSLLRIVDACKRPALAQVAMFAVPRGGKTQRGISIRLAEVMAQSWGNIGFGTREIEHVEGFNGFTKIEAFCTDFETNAHEYRAFTVYHKRKANNRIKHIEDPQEIYELVANYGSRRMRACILAIIPKHVQEQAIAQVTKTLKEGDGKPLQDRLNAIVKAFSEIDVHVDLIERRLGHELKFVSEEELIDLRAIYNSMKQGETKRQEWFDLRAEPEGGRAAELNEKLKADKPTKKEKS